MTGSLVLRQDVGRALTYAELDGNQTYLQSIAYSTTGTTASGVESFSRNHSTQAQGNYSSAFGDSSVAVGAASFASGYGTTASGDQSHTEGYSTQAAGSFAHAEGQSTYAGGNGSHAEGYGTTASGNYSHAEGYLTTASGQGSHAGGYGSIASNNYEWALSSVSPATFTTSLGDRMQVMRITQGGVCSASGSTALTDQQGNYIFLGGTASMHYVRGTLTGFVFASNATAYPSGFAYEFSCIANGTGITGALSVGPFGTATNVSSASTATSALVLRSSYGTTPGITATFRSNGTGGYYMHIDSSTWGNEAAYHAEYTINSIIKKS